ncbi:MAG: iron ABC transporter permease, partial [Gemmatimonadales bacterium]|nr:iron ABC transporter permease [Gemmatimonadales bacterium]
MGTDPRSRGRSDLHAGSRCRESPRPARGGGGVVHRGGAARRTAGGRSGADCGFLFLVTRTGRGALLLILLLAIAAISGLLLGAANVAPADAWRALTGQETDPSARTIVLSLRLPRVTAAALTGIALTISGTLFQALLRNPLAEPYLLGVSSGAALGAVLALTALGGVLGYLGTVGFALAGGLAAIGIVFRVALAVGRLDTHVLILAGVVVSAFFGAGVMLLLSLAEPDATRAAVLWTMGSLARAGWESTVALGLATAAGG